MQIIPFDRTRDVSKLVGCDVRNRSYQWNIYLQHLPDVPQGSHVLDFGAGSLRESHDLAMRGFRVTSVDMNTIGMDKCYPAYDWSQAAFEPELRSDLPAEPGKFGLVTAFDIIEHLPDPAAPLRQIHDIMAEGALAFVTVPNKLTLREYVTKRRGGAGLAPGEAHLQFKSPGEWKKLFQNTGFRVLDHEMALGPFNNTAHFLAHGLRKESWHRPFANVLHGIDELIRPVASPLFGWNLFVFRKAGKTGAVQPAGHA